MQTFASRMFGRRAVILAALVCLPLQAIAADPPGQLTPIDAKVRVYEQRMNAAPPAGIKWCDANAKQRRG